MDALIDIARDFLDSCRMTCGDYEHKELLSFIIDQLNLCFIKPHARIYSNELLVTSYLWYIHSPALYKKLSELFILPSTRRLKGVSSAVLGPNSALQIDEQYLSRRTAGLTERDKHVILSIDKISTAKRIEYCGGKLIGLNDDGKTAKSVVAFLIRSISCSYEDVVKLIPCSALTAEHLKEYFYL